MNTPNREWIKFMREQYPVGSRIRLTEMNDPYSKLKPGSEGTLMHIDDIGTYVQLEIMESLPGEFACSTRFQLKFFA